MYLLVAFKMHFRVQNEKKHRTDLNEIKHLASLRKDKNAMAIWN